MTIKVFAISIAAGNSIKYHSSEIHVRYINNRIYLQKPDMTDIVNYLKYCFLKMVEQLTYARSVFPVIKSLYI